MPTIIPELCIGLSLFVEMRYSANLDQEDHRERRLRRKQPSARLPDPRYATSRVDNHFFDDHLPDEELIAADRLIELAEQCKIALVIPHTVKRELEHPNTPASVRQKSSRLVYTMNTGMGNQVRLLKVQAIMRGNAKSGKHDADAAHLYDAALWQASYFVTLDQRILSKQNDILAELTDLWIVRPSELLKIYSMCSANRSSPPC